MADNVTIDVLRSKRAEYIEHHGQLVAELAATEGAIQALTEVIGDGEQMAAMTLDELKDAIGAKSIEVAEIAKYEDKVST